jgi:hypothetical protein
MQERATVNNDAANKMTFFKRNFSGPEEINICGKTVHRGTTEEISP